MSKVINPKMFKARFESRLGSLMYIADKIGIDRHTITNIYTTGRGSWKTIIKIDKELSILENELDLKNIKKRGH